jgi:cell division protein FtsI/penicillin-binding protein 2
LALTACLASASLLARRAWSAPPHETQPAASTTAVPLVPLVLAQAHPVVEDGGAGEESPPVHREASRLAGLDLTRITFDDGAPTATVTAGSARLTLDGELQRTAGKLMAERHFPEASVVLMETATGRLLVYASHVERPPARDLCAEATAPSASVFKIVTASALVEDAGLGPDTPQCYLGGEQRITAADLVEDPARDRWCTTLGGALGRSINTVFARLARKYLAPKDLDAMARRFGYGSPVPFDLPVQPSGVHVPDEPLEFARTAAGFWNTTLSPLQAAEISAIVARRGESVRPRVVDSVVTPAGTPLWSAPSGSSGSRVIAPETADKVGAMMEQTVRGGTCFRAFHDARGATFLPGVSVAGKTGTLSDGRAERYYTWFTGFAPSRPIEGTPTVAIAVLVVNGPVWREKANVLAREILRAYFAERSVPGVTRPALGSIARRKPRP